MDEPRLAGDERAQAAEGFSMEQQRAGSPYSGGEPESPGGSEAKNEIITTDEMRGQTLKMDTYKIGDVTMVDISGDVVGRDAAKSAMTEVMERIGVLGHPQDYLVRYVRSTETGRLLQEGTERGKTSYRDPVLERDFDLSPQDYTYCYGYEGSKPSFVHDVTKLIERKGRAVNAIYLAQEMVPHHEEQYDSASNGGIGSTRVTYSFKDPQRRSDALFAVVTYNGIFAEDDFDYGTELSNHGRTREAVAAYQRFIESPPEWTSEDSAKWLKKAEDRISELSY